MGLSVLSYPCQQSFADAQNGICFVILLCMLKCSDFLKYPLVQIISKLNLKSYDYNISVLIIFYYRLVVNGFFLFVDILMTIIEFLNILYNFT